MLLRPVRHVAVFALLSGLGTLAADVDASIGSVLGFPFRWIGGQLVGGGVDKLKGPTAKAVADVDARLTAHEVRLEGMARDLLVDAKGKVLETVSAVDNTLEARLLQIKTDADDSVDRALSQVDRVLSVNLMRAEGVGQKLIHDAGKELRVSLDRLDTVLRDRSADVERIGHDWIEHVDDVLESRIEQLDEVAGRRLGNVDVIATKQRLAFEKSALQVVALAGIVVFVVAALKRASQAYEALLRDPRLASARGTQRSLLLAGAIGAALRGPLVATLAGVALLYGVYRWLPLGAEQEAREAVAMHMRELDASVARLDYTGARFHASHLPYLAPHEAARGAALADKVGLLRDLIARPTLLATREAVQAFQARLDALEPVLGPRPDPDLLVMRAIVRWALGDTRADEHVAASLSARALGLGARGFALAPLARAYVEVYLDAPSSLDRGWSRDHATREEMRDALARAAPIAAGSPFAAAAELATQMRRLVHRQNAHYLALVEAHVLAVAESQRRPGGAELRAALACRSAEAAAIVTAWREFDAALLRLPDRLALHAFHLNDAILTRASAFAAAPEALSIPVRLEEIPARPETRELRLTLAPARVAWVRRYRALLAGPLRPIVEFEETERFRTWERWAVEFEQASLARALAASETVRVDATWRLALAASALALYVDSDGRRLPYARRVSEGVSSTPPPAFLRRTPDAPRSLEELLQRRGPRLI
jgi:hypothetical protein